MKGLCDNCLTSNVEVTSVKGKTLCSVCSNKDSNKQYKTQFLLTMKVGIFSHCTIDTIVYENEQYETAGGPASYCSFTTRKQKHDVNLYTKFGPNYPLKDFFKENNIITKSALSEKNTTQFRLELNGADRKLYLIDNFDN